MPLPTTQAATATPVRARPRIGDLLVRAGVITREQLEIALRHQSTASPPIPIGRVLVQKGFATSGQVVRALAAVVGCPFVDMEPGLVREEALRTLPVPFMEQYNVLPLNVAQGWLTVALEQFNDPFLLAEIARRSGLQVQPVAADPDLIRAARNIALAHHGDVAPGSAAGPDAPLESILGDASVEDLQVIEDTPEGDSDLEAAGTESPIVRLVNFVIKRSIECGASDIHIEPDDGHLQVRYRVDGELVPGERLSRKMLSGVVSRIKILAGMDISERRLPQDGSLTVSLQDRSVDLRVSTMTTRQGEKVVMRIVDRKAGIPKLEELGVEGAVLRSLRALAREPHGLILVTGPTGSGKSTTLYSVLSEITSDVCNTSTIEDPVERRLKGVNQFQVHEESGFTFARALRSLLRQDPDIIMVGEIRDLETARLATEASLTGHLVLSTLHTNDAASAIPRLISMGVERFMAAATLRGVLAQRLVRRLCAECRRPVEPSREQSTILDNLCGSPGAVRTAYAGAGCPRCNGRGSIGRVGVFDLLVLTEEVLARVLANGANIRSFELRTGEAPGLLADGLAKVRRGLIGIESLLELACHAGDDTFQGTVMDPSPDQGTGHDAV